MDTILNQMFRYSITELFATNGTDNGSKVDIKKDFYNWAVKSYWVWFRETILILGTSSLIYLMLKLICVGNWMNITSIAN